MRLIFAWVGRFRNYRETGVELVPDFRCEMAGGRLHIRKSEMPEVLEAVFGESPLRNLTVVVGETGSGKTNLFQLIGMDSYHRVDLREDSHYLLLWENERTGRFVAEICNVRPMNLPFDLESYELEDSFIKLVQFEWDFDRQEARGIRTLERDWDARCYVVNCFDRDSFPAPPCRDVHREGTYPDEYFPRMVTPFRRVNVGVACEHLRNYLLTLPEGNVKRRAALRIEAFNWSDDVPAKIDEELEKEQYWTYRDRRFDASLTSRPMPAGWVFPSAKEQFLHDLLADFALYLRKWAEQRWDEDAESAEELMLMGMLTPKPGELLPDLLEGNGSTEDLLRCVEWNASFIDRHSADEWASGQGLVWQIADDIKDIYHILNEFDEKYFTAESFSLPIIEMAPNDKRVEDLFERMTAYRPDEAGIFTKELLPYQITGISAGEYQYAKTLGIVDEYCVRLKVSARREKREYIQPDFILLLDEPEAYMHPELCRRFVWLMGEILQKHSEESMIQIVMSTHSPFMLSDVLSSQVIRLKADERGYCRVLPRSERETFAAGIHSIMANEFFLDFTIGEHSRRLLTALMENLKVLRQRGRKKPLSRAKQSQREALLDRARTIAPSIGDEMLRGYLEALLEEAEE